MAMKTQLGTKNKPVEELARTKNNKTRSKRKII